MPRVNLLIEIHGIECRRRDDALVTENLLDFLQRCSALDRLACPGMAHRVRIVPASDAGLAGQALEDLIDAASGERAAHSDEDARAGIVWPLLIEVTAQRIRCALLKVSVSRLIAFLPDPRTALVEIEIGKCQADQATDATGRVGKETDDGVVACAFALCGSEKPFQIIRRHVLRRIL